jgi:hypothetical protein
MTVFATRSLRHLVMTMAIGLPSMQALAEVVLYEHSNFKGITYTVEGERAVPDMSREGFANRASSAWVKSGRWQLCSDGNYNGHCVVLGPGRYANLRDQGLNDAITSARYVGASGWGKPPVGGNWRDGGPHETLVMYENADFGGVTYTVEGRREVGDLKPEGFNDRASSLWVKGGHWQVCSDADFRGHCVTLGAGRYANLRDQGLNDTVSSVRFVGSGGWGRDNWQSGGRYYEAIVLYERSGFDGLTYTVEGQRSVDNLGPAGFNDKASSAWVKGGRWEVCSDARYGGQCITLGPGRYPSFRDQGMNNTISSVRYLGG